MKTFKILFSVCFLALSCLCMCTSCEDEEYRDFIAPTIDISQTESEHANALTIQFTPSAGTAHYKYAISDDADFSTFTDGTMEGIKTVQGEEKQVAVFEGLNSGRTYYIYAQAFNSENQSGGLASRRIVFTDKDAEEADKVRVTQEYNLSTSTAFRIGYPSQYIRCRYLLGKASDREAFIKGEAAGEKSLYELPVDYVLSYFDLEPETDYVFYAQALHIVGTTSELFEIPFTTPARDEAPYAEFEIVEEDAFRQHYRLTPNGACGKIVCVFNEAGQGAESLVYGLGWSGDWARLIESWDHLDSKNPNLMTYKAERDGDPVEIIFNDYTFAFSVPKTMQALLFDETGENPVGVQYYSFKKLDCPSEARPAKVTLEVKDITQQGATYIYKCDENTLGYYFDTIDADWWDKNKDQFLAKDPHYLQNLLAADHIFNYGKDFLNKPFEFREIKAKPGHRYYAVACPMNIRGKDFGWEEPVMVEYTTLSE